jgi:hypothetical protein
MTDLIKSQKPDKAFSNNFDLIMGQTKNLFQEKKNSLENSFSSVSQYKAISPRA